MIMLRFSCVVRKKIQSTKQKNHCSSFAQRSLIMIIPIRCFTCGKVTGDKWERYCVLLQQKVPSKDVLDQLGLKRLCCRRMLFTHVDLVDRLIMVEDVKTSDTDTIYFKKQNNSVSKPRVYQAC